ncbi:MAG: hypothetical protein COA82_03345 [Alkaliphilus sp.]|nr:hypothetical protein [bacterium AH-315-E09]PHS35841.1 MAG: hypothetical protein COA82_03345 [Alkaliphilus sp.]
MFANSYDFIVNFIAGISVIKLIIAAIVVLNVITLITSLFFNLGINLKKRQIAIFSSRETYESLSEYLTNSNIFKQKNIIHVKEGNLEKGKTATMYIVEWKTFGQEIDQIFTMRGNMQTPAIVYATPGEIPREKMGDISMRSNTVVVNARGRLLNDVFVSMMTTGYKGSRLRRFFGDN